MQALEKAKEIGWYHTIELAPGHVTEGMFDLRGQMDGYGLPARLDGMRVLDVGTWDGFWAFEMERRGAAEVISLDLDWEQDLDWPPRRRPKEFPDAPRGAGFQIARELLDSNVERMSLSVYDATPEEIGSFDLVFCGSVLIHLRDQLLALERIANLCTGTFISAEEYDRTANLVPFPVSRYHADRDKAVVFWLPSIRTWKRMLWTAGFDRVEQHSRFKVVARAGWSVPHVVHHAHKQ
ncbi:MAG: tRNA (mo5U34)-methyltransferase [Thermoleophilaceae bacterium]|nr:tRNA (mo5U34)-methyltransferase [Thermoleophilaceae bacterium]